MMQLREVVNFAIVRVRRLDHFSWTEGAQIDLLDGDQSVMVLEVLGFVDHAEATFANPAEDPVALSEQRARTQ